MAAVYDPSRRELFTAERGRGARLNGQPIRVSPNARFADAVLGTGFPHGAVARVPAMETLLAECAVRARAVRRLGSAALDLCYVACGRMDAFWDRNLKAWDTAAGALVVTEAGGTVTSLDGGPFSCYPGDVLASNGPLHADMLDAIRRAAARTCRASLARRAWRRRQPGPTAAVRRPSPRTGTTKITKATRAVVTWFCAPPGRDGCILAAC